MRSTLSQTLSICFQYVSLNLPKTRIIRFTHRYIDEVLLFVQAFASIIYFKLVWKFIWKSFLRIYVSTYLVIRTIMYYENGCPFLFEKFDLYWCFVNQSVYVDNLLNLYLVRKLKKNYLQRFHNLCIFFVALFNHS